MKRKLTLFLLTAFVICGCEDKLNFTEEPSDTLSIVSLPDGFQYARIGERQPNPLSMENIRAAFAELDSETKAGYSENDIRPTHRYIAFTPTNEEELNVVSCLDEDVFVLSTYPLDYEVSDGLIVPDPRFMKNGYSYTWAYVPMDVDLSNIDCPYIYYYDIYSPNEDSVTKADGSLPSALSQALEVKSHEMCGQTLIPLSETKADRVHPSGRFRFFDADSSKYRGVAGLAVRTVRASHSGYTHCDENGDFTSSLRYLYAFRYEIHFSRTDFKMCKNSESSEIVYKFSDYKGPIYKDFDNDEMAFYAVVSRAAIIYYYRDNCGLRRPPMKDDKSARLVIQAQLGSNPNGYGRFTYEDNWIFADRPVLNIYRKESPSTRRNNADIYATTMHELAHASHWRNNENGYMSTDYQVIESFARGVQWILASNVYPGYQVPFYYRQSYTGIVQDLIDGVGVKETSIFAIWINDQLARTYCLKSYYDNVTGFTPQQIETAVRKSKTWGEWRYNLINDNPGVANEADVVDAFTYWNTGY